MNMMPDDREGFAAFLLRLRGRGIVPKNLIAAFEATPRRDFLAGQFHSIAWSDRMLPIECGEAIEGADLQAAVMARLAGRVVTVERFKTLTELARQRFEMLGLGNALVRQADGSNGLQGEGPFDRIVVWAAFDSHPRMFVDQLSSGGTMIAPIGPEEGEQVLCKLTKIGSRFEREDLGVVRLQPLARGVAAVI
jgi:protein-L-isoaspartate(D-aspartate) O-methyltransferase